MMPSNHSATVASIETVGQTLRIITLEPETKLAFVPGQFISLQIPDLNGGTTYRSYSIASHPDDSLMILCASVHNKPESCGYSFLRNLKAGDTISFRGPFGRFLFEPHLERTMVFIAGGSGIAPIHSMLLEYEKKQMKNSAYLYYGIRKSEDLCFREDFERIHKTMPQFHFIPCLSDPGEAGGAQGRVTDVLERLHQTYENSDFYLCGNPLMVKAAKEILQTKGVTSENIKQEAY